MSLSQIKEQVSHLPDEEQRQLITFLFSLRSERDGDFKARMARKIDDDDPSHWIELDELKKRYTD